MIRKSEEPTPHQSNRKVTKDIFNSKPFNVEMRKNLLLLIMFCLIATIGANATATKSGTTLTFTDCKAGEIKSYLENSETKSCLSTITSVVVIGAINGDDIQSMQFTKLQSLDLSKATGLTSGDDLKFTSGTGNLQNKLKSTLETIKFPKGPTGIPASCMISFTSLSNVIIPSGYKTIGSEAFRNRSSSFSE